MKKERESERKAQSKTQSSQSLTWQRGEQGNQHTVRATGPGQRRKDVLVKSRVSVAVGDHCRHRVRGLLKNNEG